MSSTATIRTLLVFAGLVLAVLGTASLARAQDYFDVNGATPGSGVTNGGSYTWDTNGTTNFSTDSTGSSATSSTSWGGSSNLSAVFVAGADAANDSFSVQLDGTSMQQTWFNNMTLNSGNLTLTNTGGGANFVFNLNGGSWNVAAGSTLTDDNTGQFGVNLNNNTMNMTGAGNTVFNANVGNNGGVNVNGTGTVTFAQGFSYGGGDNTTLAINSGTVAVDTPSPAPAGYTFSPNGVTHVTAGSVAGGTAVTTLGGDGFITAAVSIGAGGNLAPSLGSPSTLIGAPLNFNGALSFVDSTATFTVDLKSPTVGVGYDQISYGSSVASSVVLGGATLAINDGLYASSPHLGDTFWIMDGLANSSAVSGEFTYNGALLANNAVFTDANNVQYRINYNAVGDPGGFGHDVQLTVVPEPASLVLLGLGAGGMWVVARRRRQG